MKRVVCAAALLIASAAPAPACDRSLSYAPTIALAVPVFVADHCAAPATAVFVAPVVDPVVVVHRPLFVPRARVQVFSPRNRVRVFGR